jgi:hypothetical protein
MASGREIFKESEIIGLHLGHPNQGLDQGANCEDG